MKGFDRFALVLGVVLMMTGQSALAQDDAACDVDNGERQFRKCMTCHTLEEGKNRVGPSLWGVFGRTAGTLPGFNYSKGMKESGVVWDATTIDGYIENPRGYIPKNRMSFPGIKDLKARADLICFLETKTK